MPNNVDERDFYCTLCFDVFFYPVTLPCKHRFCKDCFDNHVKCNSFTCPLCRARLSNWIRKLNQTNANIVDSKFWETVQKIYPKEVEKRRNGDVDGELSSALINADKAKKDSAENLHKHFQDNKINWKSDWQGWEGPVSTACRDLIKQVVEQTTTGKQRSPRRNDVPKLRLAAPGEIRLEYEDFLRKQEEEQKRREDESFRLSQPLIKMIEEHEKKEEEERKRKLEEQLLADEELARRLLEEETHPVKVTVSDRTACIEEESSHSVVLGEYATPGSSVQVHCSTPKCLRSEPDQAVPALSPIPLDQPSTSKEDIFAKYYLTSTSLSDQNLSHFATVRPGPSSALTSEKEPEQQQQQQPVSMSRCSSGADSIGQELRHFKPIRSSPTTPPKAGSSWLPQIVVAQRGVGTDQSQVVVTEVLSALCNNPDSDISPQELENSIFLQKQLEADRELALELQKQLNSENKRKRSVPTQKTDYNLRKRKKGNLRKQVLVDRAQATLDSMLIK
uniref:RING-type E3 ubiquitin transferase n=1 Tax=Homalodisca liturata TaxID=320908 RepID=A0A1B6I3J9_9HEMI